MCQDKISEKEQLKGRRAHLSLPFGGRGKAKAAEVGGSWIHCVHHQDEEREERQSPLTLPFLVSLGAQPGDDAEHSG